MSGTEFCELHEVEYMEVLIRVSVRWLSLWTLFDQDPQTLWTSGQLLQICWYGHHLSISLCSNYMDCWSHTCIIDNLLFCVIYWLIEDENPARFKRLVQTFTDPMTEVYLLFFQATVPTFTTFNLLLQRERSSIFMLYDEVGLDFAVFLFCVLLISAGIF